ncbi:GNAT family N-acetyltransferase [Haladaptatus sp. ZSTT2]|uniref:GNAT family N-acetyltransferase n=1 Tax=Haladaptatus sp. ZSTT2 TaxID=3120515 RepID=UPI00300EC387
MNEFYMGILNGTKKFGSGNPTTTQVPAVRCPDCGETVFTESFGEVTCETCENSFHVSGHFGETCTAVVCDACGTDISFIQENRIRIVDWETYYCSKCHQILAVQTEDGPQSIKNMLSTDWVLNDRSVESIAITFGDNYWMKQTETNREQFATDLLNLEARAKDSSFNAYSPDSTNAYLCFTEDYCVGYITWNLKKDHPELGQLYILPEFRRRGIGSGFVEAWRNDVTGGDSHFLVNNPNADMFRLLHSLGMVDVTDEGPEFHGFDWSGNWLDFPDEWNSV